MCSFYVSIVFLISICQFGVFSMVPPHRNGVVENLTDDQAKNLTKVLNQVFGAKLNYPSTDLKKNREIVMKVCEKVKQDLEIDFKFNIFRAGDNFNGLGIDSETELDVYFLFGTPFRPRRLHHVQVTAQRLRRSTSNPQRQTVRYSFNRKSMTNLPKGIEEFLEETTSNDQMAVIDGRKFLNKTVLAVVESLNQVQNWNHIEPNVQRVSATKDSSNPGVLVQVLLTSGKILSFHITPAVEVSGVKEIQEMINWKKHKDWAEMQTKVTTGGLQIATLVPKFTDSNWEIDFLPLKRHMLRRKGFLSAVLRLLKVLAKSQKWNSATIGSSNTLDAVVLDYYYSSKKMDTDRKFVGKMFFEVLVSLGKKALSGRINDIFIENLSVTRDTRLDADAGVISGIVNDITVDVNRIKPYFD